MKGDLSVAFTFVSDGDRAGLAKLLASEPSLASATNDEGMPLLHAAAQTDDAEMVDTVLTAGAEVDTRAAWGHTALEWAANMNARRAAELLLARGSKLTLWAAAALGRLEEVGAFLEAGPDAQAVSDAPAGPDAEAVSDAFYIACRNGALDVARLLRRHGADVDALGYFDATALHWAAINGHEETALWLVDQGADVRRRDPEFDATPAGWAREGGHDALAHKLELESP